MRFKTLLGRHAAGIPFDKSSSALIFRYGRQSAVNPVGLVHDDFVDDIVYAGLELALDVDI